MSKKFNLLVLIGRFQPFHTAHLEIVQRASKIADRVLIIIGSTDQPRTYKNPFNASERKEMIHSVMAFNDIAYQIETIADSVYNDQAWVVRVQNAVDKHSSVNDKIGIIGHKKDDSSYYLDMFPTWEFIGVDQIEPLGATDIRELYFRDEVNMNFIKNVVPKEIFQYLTTFKKTEYYKQIIKERAFVENYKKQFAGLSYPPVFVTSDAVVICSGHVLMIKRRSEPGKGLWAFPGGFLNANTDRSMEDCMIRELKEETGIKIPIPVLKGSIEESKVFDAIERSARGRTITHAFKIVLNEKELPKVKGADDAEKAKWLPINKVNGSICFEDHAEILNYFVGA